MSPIETGPDNTVTIKVVGAGGAGNNAIDRMVKFGMQGAEFIAVNTDKPALSGSNADVRIQIGEKLTKGQGAGADPEVGRKAAEESRNELAKALENSDMVFIACGMGGGTGTGAAPVIADIAREIGALTVGVVTKPFGFEGSHRMKQATEGIEVMRGKVDALFVIPNDRLRLITEEKITLRNAFEIADKVLHEAVSHISEIINVLAVINLDFADVTAVMKNAGYSHFGVGQSSGKNKMEEAVRQAIASALMETSVNGAKGILVYLTGSNDLALEDVDDAINIVREAAYQDAEIFFGVNMVESMEDELSVVIVATKFDAPAVTPPAAPPVRNEPKRHPLFPETPKEDRYEPVPGHEMPPVPATPPVAPVQPTVSNDPPPDDDPFDTLFKIFNSK